MKSQRFLDPEILSRISNLELLARTVVEGFIAGLHKSPYKGFSVEFMEYRQYVPGDDLKRLDWKVFARTDRLFVKEFEEETNTTCSILLDISNSMGYESGKITKLEYASYLAATLAYFMIRQRDGVGLYLFDERITTFIPPKSTRAHLFSMLTALERIEPGRKTNLGKPFHELAEAIKRRGIVVIISDLFDRVDSIVDGLKHLVFNGNEVILFHILDPLEESFNFSEVIEFEDMETGEKMLVSGEIAREVYREKISGFMDTIRTESGLLGVDYRKFNTNQPLDFALFEYLVSRSRFS